MTYDVSRRNQGGWPKRERSATSTPSRYRIRGKVLPQRDQPAPDADVALLYLLPDTHTVIADLLRGRED